MERLRSSGFTRRVIAAAVLLPLVVVVTYLGGLAFALLVTAAALLAGYEFFALMRKGGFRPQTLTGLAIVLLMALDSLEPRWNLLAPGLTAAVVLSLTWELFRSGRSPVPTADWALTLAGGIYVGWLARHFILLRGVDGGYTLTMLAFLVTWAGDSGAYFVGLLWGKRPFWPRLSPRKTWEGTIGGWLTGVFAALILGMLAGIAPLHSLGIGVVVSTLAPFGDLSVSMFKRQVGVKDSSNLIPGHGGMLDRVDSLLFTVAGVYYYATLVMGL